MQLPSGQLPGGFKQRLAMAAALLHEPEILFLDEPTSGADPLARREFWRRITALSSQGVTVIVTTHFMEEAEYCDRIAILDGGRILAQGTPAEVRGLAPASRRARARHGRRLHRRGRTGAQACARAARKAAHEAIASAWPPRCIRVAALVRKEARQLVRDPSSIAIGIILPVMLILLFGYGLSLDVKNVPVAVVLEDTSPAASELAAGFRLSPYFAAEIMTSMPRAEELMLERRGRRHRARPQRFRPALIGRQGRGADPRPRQRRQPRTHHRHLCARRDQPMGGAAHRRGQGAGSWRGRRRRRACGSTRPTTATISSCLA